MSENEKIIVVFVIVFTLLLVFFGLFFIYLIALYKKRLEGQKKLALDNLILGQDKERERLARDMHDQMGPQLNAIAALVSDIKSLKPEDQELIDEVKEELWKSTKEVRRISHDLMPTTLKKYGLYQTLLQMKERFESPDFSIEIKMDEPIQNPGEKQSAHLFRISQELLQNTLKHSGASHAQFEIRSDRNRGETVFTYTDNGRGDAQFDVKKAGIGLSNIKTRAELMQGELDLRMTQGFFCEIKFK